MTKRTLFIILSLVALTLIGALLMFMNRDKSGPLMQRMSLREKVTLEIIQDGNKNLANDDLQKINSELLIVLNGHNNALSAAFKKNNMPPVETKKMDNPETSKPVLEKLRTAKLNARYDETYRSALKLQLESLNELSRELHKITKSKSLKEALSTQYTDVAKYIKQLHELTPA